MQRYERSRAHVDAGLNMVSYPDPKDYCIMNLREITNIRITREITRGVMKMD